MADPSTVEKGGAGFEWIKLLPCENPLPRIEEAIEAAEKALRGASCTRLDKSKRHPDRVR